MYKRTILALAAAAVAVTGLSGCSALQVGEENFACEGMPGSVFCRSTRDVYNVTDSGVVPSPMQPGDAYNEECDDCVKSEDVNPALRDLTADDSGARASAPAADTGDYVFGAAIARRGGATSVSGSPSDPAAGSGVAVIERPDGTRVLMANVTDDEVINNFVTPNLPTKPVPIRTPAQIMRVWIAPYEAENGNLQAPGYVYTEVEPRRWIYPNDPNAHNPRVFAPLSQTPPADMAAHLPAQVNAGRGVRGGSRTYSDLRQGLPEENSLERFARAQRSR